MKWFINTAKERFNRSQVKLQEIIHDNSRVEQSRLTGKRNNQSLPPRRQLLNLIGGVNETETIRSIVRMVAPILGHNPRRLKQFVNLFRLRVHIAYETGLFDAVLGSVAVQTLTLEQLGKFVALSQMYPRLLFDLRGDRWLLKKLEYRARKLGLAHESDFTEGVRRWEQQPEVLDLLSYGLDDTSSPMANQYSLERLDVDKLLQVAPYVPRQNANSENIDIQTQRRTGGVPGGGLKRNDVLVLIDADEEMSKLTGEYFSHAGFKVVLLEYKPTTVLDVLNASPNVIVLGDDSKMDRLAVCRQLRENAPHIPVLMLSAYDNITDKLSGLEAGAVDYITKPFSLRELEARIKVSLKSGPTEAA
jgi:CheY-like chemotaxis protein